MKDLSAEVLDSGFWILPENVENAENIRNMQYQVDPTNQTQENGYFRNENQTGQKTEKQKISRSEAMMKERIGNCIHTCIRTCTRACTRACICACIRAFIHACIRAAGSIDTHGLSLLSSVACESDSVSLGKLIQIAQLLTIERII